MSKYLWRTFAVALFHVFAALSYGQFQGAGTYLTSSGEIISLVYNGDESWSSIIWDDWGGYTTIEISDDEFFDYTQNVLGYGSSYLADEAGQWVATPEIDLMTTTSPYAGQVGYVLVYYSSGRTEFVGSINGSTIGNFSDNPLDNFDLFTDAVGDYIDWGGTLSSSSVAGLESLFIGSTFDSASIEMGAAVDSMMNSWNSFMAQVTGGGDWWNGQW